MKECCCSRPKWNLPDFLFGIKAKTLSSICNVPKDKGKYMNYSWFISLFSLSLWYKTSTGRLSNQPVYLNIKHEFPFWETVLFFYLWRLWFRGKVLHLRQIIECSRKADCNSHRALFPERVTMLSFWSPLDGRCSQYHWSRNTDFWVSILLSKMRITITLQLGSKAQGAKAKPVYVRAHWRVRNGKKHYVKAHYRYR